MSVVAYVFLRDKCIPNRGAWQHAIDWLQLEVMLDPSFDVRKDTGFQPATFRGEETGFEFYLSSSADVVADSPKIAEMLDGRDQCAVFRWGGDLIECAAALSAAAALVKMSGGLYYCDDEGLLREADDALEAIREELNAI